MKMSQPFQSLVAVSVAAAVLCCASRAGEPADAGVVDFGQIAPSGSGGEFVEVHIQSHLLSMLARLVETEEPDAAALIRGIRLIRVNVLSMDDSNRQGVVDRVRQIRAELDAKGWERLVTARKDTQDVGVYLKTRGDEAVEGLVVTVLDGEREAVLVNIVGNIRPEAIATLGERLNIDPLKKVAGAIGSK